VAMFVSRHHLVQRAVQCTRVESMTPRQAHHL
jgi:hypothetical protein